MRTRALLGLLAVTLSPRPVPAAEEARRGLTAEDYFAFEFLSDPRISPDGTMVAYVQATIDSKANKRISQVWLVRRDGTEPPRQFTAGSVSSSSPRWSPDGQSLAFLSARPTAEPATPKAGSTSETPKAGSAPEPPKNQIYVLSMHGGEARPLTSLKGGVVSCEWSPDGKRFVALSRVGPSDEHPSKADTRHYRHARYKFNDTGWFDDKRSHLFVVDAQTGAAKQVTEGEDWNDTDPRWSPDSTRIAFVSDRTGKSFDESHNTDVWVVAAEGGPLVKISDHEGADESPRWSPDGQTIAFLGQVHDTENDPVQIWLAPAAGGQPSRLAATDLDLIPANLHFVPDALLFEAGSKGETHIFRVDLASRTTRAITSGARAVRSFDRVEKTGELVYLANDFTHLDDLYTSDAVGKGERALTHANAALWSKLDLQNVERFSFKGADGWDVDGFVVKPVGWKEGQKYPTILNIHGGPAGMYGVDFYHEFQVYSGKGYGVVFTNPRGSTGYGHRFQRGIALEWGGKDYVDIMNGLQAAIARSPWIDKDRLGVTGGSYGGFMTNWIVGHTTLFKAAVTLRSISNFVSDEGTRDGAYGHKDDFGGLMFDRFEYFWDRSPLKYVRNVKTPILILHSDNDYRVPLEQGEQWFRALQHYGVPSEFVIFPRENHNLTRTGEPQHLVESLNWQAYWFDRYLNKNDKATPPDHP
jgi:dipeptidyl aminopeptidase/acylaminoacyl peptidase